ncbi:MAG: hypothetical protein QRY72_03415 [Candidatus Rhabdochlamydia sp.]
MKMSNLDEMINFLVSGEPCFESQFTPPIARFQNSLVGNELDRVKTTTQKMWIELRNRLLYLSLISGGATLLLICRMRNVSLNSNLTKFTRLFFLAFPWAITSLFLGYKAAKANSRSKKCDDCIEIFKIKKALIQIDSDRVKFGNLFQLSELMRDYPPSLYERAINSFNRFEKRDLTKLYFQTMDITIHPSFFSDKARNSQPFSIEEEVNAVNIPDITAPFFEKYTQLELLEPFFGPVLYRYFSASFQNIKEIVDFSLTYSPEQLEVNEEFSQIRNLFLELIRLSSYKEEANTFMENWDSKNVSYLDKTSLYALGIIYHKFAREILSQIDLPSQAVQIDFANPAVVQQLYRNHVIGVLMFNHFKKVFYSNFDDSLAKSKLLHWILDQSKQIPTLYNLCYKNLFAMVDIVNPELSSEKDNLYNFLNLWDDLKHQAKLPKCNVRIPNRSPLL